MQFEVIDLGLTDLKTAWEFQKEIFPAVRNINFASTLILCQHYPVITLGRKANRSNILVNETELNLKGIGICEIERGGDVTYHGPGQLIAYPVFDLSIIKKDINYFLRFLETVIIKTLFEFGVPGERLDGFTGVWFNKKKIASIGIAVRNWIAFHGLSINIKKDDLANFNLIRPCGMDIEMTSLESVLGRNIEINEVREGLIKNFREVLLLKENKEDLYDQSCFAGIK
jgi:lipoate-protein ligase B